MSEIEASENGKVKKEYSAASTPANWREKLEEYRETKRLAESFQEDLDKLKQELQEMAEQEGAEAVKTPFGSVGWGKGRRMEKLDKLKLLEAGVEAETIKACTVVTEGKPSFRVTIPREAGES